MNAVATSDGLCPPSVLPRRVAFLRSFRAIQVKQTVSGLVVKDAADASPVIFRQLPPAVAPPPVPEFGVRPEVRRQEAVNGADVSHQAVPPFTRLIFEKAVSSPLPLPREG